MHDSHPDSIIIPGRIPPKEICFVNSLVDDLEGIAVMRTVDPVEGRMEYWVAPDLLDEFYAFMHHVRDDYGIPVEYDDPIPHTTEFPPGPA
ncbi:MAG: DUF4911 domain-containing protein [bacterium]|jgi:hypothetical protein|nr:DUF4911 domain-containing protein [bacterium]